MKDEEAALGLDAPPPMSDAIQAVAELERQVLGAGGLVLRYGFFYGPGTQFAPDGFYADLARKRRFPVVGSGDGHWSFIHVEDAAGHARRARARGARDLQHRRRRSRPRSQLVPVYAAAVGAKRPFRCRCGWAGWVAVAAAVSGMTTQRAASNAKAKRDLARTPRHSQLARWLPAATAPSLARPRPALGRRPPARAGACGWRSPGPRWSC